MKKSIVYTVTWAFGRQGLLAPAEHIARTPNEAMRVAQAALGREGCSDVKISLAFRNNPDIRKVEL